MTKTTTPLTLGAPLENGTFAGITTRQDGTHCAVVLLAEQSVELTWKKALTWAKKQGGELPSRPVASMLFANVKSALKPGWHWSSEEDDASFAWQCDFDGGDLSIDHKSGGGCAVAVRLIPFTS